MPSCSALPELTDEQIDSLPPEVRQTYRQPRAVDPAELVRFLGHTDLVNAAWAFLMPVCVDGANSTGRYGRTWIPTSGRYWRRSGCVQPLSDDC